MPVAGYSQKTLSTRSTFSQDHHRAVAAALRTRPADWKRVRGRPNQIRLWSIGGGTYTTTKLGQPYRMKKSISQRRLAMNRGHATSQE